MIRFASLLALVLISVATASSTGTSAAAVPDKLPVADAVALALENTVGMNRARVQRLDTLSGLRQAEVSTSYELSAEAGRTDGQDVNESSSSITGAFKYTAPFGTSASLLLSPYAAGTNSGSIGVSVEHPLMRGSGRKAERYNRLVTARSAARLSDRVLFDSRQRTVLEIVSAYYNAVLSRDRVQIQKAAVDLARQTAEYMRKREEAELEAGIQVIQAEVWALQSEETLNQTEQASKTAVDALLLAMGLNVGQTPELVDDVPLYDPALPDVNEAKQAALRNRIELSQMDEDLAEQSRLVAVKGDQFRPELGLTARWSSSSRHEGLTDFNLLSLGSSFVGLKVSMPMDKRLIREDKAMAERHLDVLRQERRFSEEEITNEVIEANRGVQRARASLINLNESLKIAEREEYLARRRVEENIGIARDVVSAQQNLASFRIQIKEARLDLYLAHLRFSRAKGDDLTGIVGAL